MIRQDTLLGDSKIIVGDKFSDLVLETLGKIYIKTGSKLETLTEIISALKTTTVSNNETITTNDITNLIYPGDYKFIFDTLSETLYFSYKESYIQIVQNNSVEDRYVKKTGDIMSGTLSINVKDKSPLIVYSKQLVNNLNVEYLGGLTADKFAQKYADETITGKWVFSNNIIFDNTTTFNSNLIINAGLGSKLFMSGYSGYGWFLDNITNTLTIDNLVVRKALSVYELVVNQIKTTNGSLWITNSLKVDSASYISLLNLDVIDSIINFDDLTNAINLDQYYIFDVPSNIERVTLQYLSSTSINKDNSTTIYTRFKYCFKILNIDILYATEDDSGNTLTPISIDNLKTAIINNDLSSYDSHITDNIIIVDLFSDLDINHTTYIIPQDTLFSYTSTGTTVEIYPYYKYFSTYLQSSIKVGGRLYKITPDSESLATFVLGDIIRCQKKSNNSIKYYDAIVVKIIDSDLIIQIADSFLDKVTIYEYDSDGNKILSDVVSNTLLYNESEDVLYFIEKGDGLVQTGNIKDPDRQNGIYLTSTDINSPYMDVLSNMNRPDFSVVYIIPKYKKLEYITFEDGHQYTGIKYNYYLQTVPITNGVEIVEESITYYGTIFPTSDTIKIINESEYQYIEEGTVKVRLGKLDGIKDETFTTKQPYGYGLYSQNVFLTGEFYLDNGKSVVEFSADQIKLEYANAGLFIKPDTTDPTKTVIYMDADKFTFSVHGNPIITLNSLFNSDGTFNPDLVTVSIRGIVETDGLIIYKRELLSSDGLYHYIGNDNSIMGTDYDLLTSDERLKLVKTFEVTKEGYLYAINGTFSGSLQSVTGSFKSLNWIDDDNNVVASFTASTTGGIGTATLSFSGTYGRLWFQSVDMYHQGTFDDRSLRFYSSDIWCRGAFGARLRTVLRVYGNAARYYPNGLDGTYVSVTLTAKTDPSSRTYYDIPMYGSIGDSNAMPVDILILSGIIDSNYNLLMAETQRALIVNTNNDVIKHIYHNGVLTEWSGGQCGEVVKLQSPIVPEVLSSVLGSGLLICSKFDNGW